MVDVVVPDSPASHAHVLVGDEVLGIERPGMQRARGCTERGWETDVRSHTTHLTLRRGGRTWEATIPLVTVRSLLERAWNTRSPYEFAALRAISAVPGPHAYGSYMLGFRWSRRGDRLLVDSVLAGSPADLAGVTVGDAILAINSVAVRDARASDFVVLAPADYQAEATLTVERGGTRTTLNLKSAGLSEILRGLSPPPARPAIRSAETM